jgi:hypothetical protein
VFFFGKIDKSYYKTILTPFQIIAYPFIIILTVYLFVQKKMGYYVLDHRAILYWIIGLFLMWMPGMLIPILIKNKIKTNVNVSSINSYDFSNIMSLIVYITLPFVVLKFIKALILFHGFTNIGYDNFIAYFGSGLAGHIMTLYIIVFIYLLTFSALKSKLNIITLLIIFSSFFLYQVKSWIFIPIISALICRLYLNRIKLNLKFYLYLVFVSFFIFVSVYIFSFRRDVELSFSSIISFYTDSTQFLFRHSLSYCFSGILGLSGHLDQNMPFGIDKSLLFNNLKNIYFFMFDRDEIRSAVTKFFVRIGQEAYETSNVKTFFGTIYIFGGPLFGSVYIFLCGLILYLKLIVLRYFNNPFFLILYSFFLSALFFGWFDFYYNGLTYIEIPVALIILSIIYDILNRNRKLLRAGIE